MKVTTTCEFDTVKIYFDDVLHLSIYIKNLVAVQGWHESVSFYHINYYTKDRVIKTQYSSREIWSEILKQIDEFI